MDDKEQAAIDALRAAGLEDEAYAVEQLRARHKTTMDSLLALQRYVNTCRDKGVAPSLWRVERV